MSPDLVTAIVSAAGALLVAMAGYLFAKRAEREAAWRSEKLLHYKAFMTSLNGIFEGQGSEEGQRAFARACNDILLFAPRPVIHALFRFQDASRSTNLDRTQEEHDAALSNLVLAIRHDLRLRPREKGDTFRVRLWVPGKPPSPPVRNSNTDR